MPRSHHSPDLTRMFYEPELNTLYERDFRRVRPKSRRQKLRQRRPQRRRDREAQETFIRHACRRDRERQEEVRANLAVDPEKKAVFDALLPRIEA